MKKSLVSSVLLALAMNVSAADKAPSKVPETPPEVQGSIQEIMSDVACGPREKVDEVLKDKAGAVPLIATHSSATNMEFIVFVNPNTQKSIFIKIDGDVACIMGSGTEMIINTPGGTSL